MAEKGLGLSTRFQNDPGAWTIPEKSVAYDAGGIRSRLLCLDQPCFAVRDNGRVGLSNEGAKKGSRGAQAVAWVPPLPIEQLGDEGFRTAHGTAYAYYAGAMANGIASEELVIAQGKAGFLASFGAAGLEPGRVKKAILAIQGELPQGPYMFNLIHSPAEPALEKGCVDLYLEHGVRCVEAAAYLDLTPFVVRYRLQGLRVNQQNEIETTNRIIAKISRKEVATRFMEPAPERILKKLLEQGLITEEQAKLSQHIPMADDVTVEADSAGHTDNRPMFALLPSIVALRDELQEKYNYPTPVRVGAGGGIGTPTAALATYIMGAAYIVTGSVNQACVEAGASEHTRTLLAKADMADVIMAPAADMFEMGVKLQCLKRGTLFAMRAQKLYELYANCASIEDIPAKEREKLEKQVFRTSLDQVWQTTVDYFSKRDPSQIEKAEKNPKRKMALVFRWYLGLSSRWSVVGEAGREMDYQIWCGPSMGAFNAWTEGTYLAELENRKVVDVARHILTGAAFAYRVEGLKGQGVRFPAAYCTYRPQPL